MRAGRHRHVWTAQTPAECTISSTSCIAGTMTVLLALHSNCCNKQCWLHQQRSMHALTHCQPPAYTQASPILNEPPFCCLQLSATRACSNCTADKARSDRHLRCARFARCQLSATTQPACMSAMQMSCTECYVRG